MVIFWSNQFFRRVYGSVRSWYSTYYVAPGSASVTNLRAAQTRYVGLNASTTGQRADADAELFS